MTLSLTRSKKYKFGKRNYPAKTRGKQAGNKTYNMHVNIIHFWENNKRKFLREV